MSGPHRNHVELRAKKIAARQYVSETHDHKPDARRRPYYTALDIARDFAGVSLDTFYRTREERHTRDGLPRPYQIRPMRFDRDSIDAWRTRYNPMRPQPPANDTCAPLVPLTDEEHRGRLLKAYGSAS